MRYYVPIKSDSSLEMKQKMFNFAKSEAFWTIFFPEVPFCKIFLSKKWRNSGHLSKESLGAFQSVL
jgi:hypothetical protein